MRLDLDLTYEEELVEILTQEVKELWNKQIPLVKVLWRNHKTKEATWESGEVMRQQYPQLSNESNFEDERSRACGERRLVIFLQVTKSLRDQEEEGCLVFKNQKIKGMETKP